VERDQIPVIGLQIAIVSLIVTGFLWVNGFLEKFNNIDYFTIILGTLLATASTLISQLIYNVWKIIGGFGLYDINKILCDQVPKKQHFKIQVAFDNFWHNDDNVNKSIIEYSRRRSVVCQMNLFAFYLLIFSGLLFFIIFITYLSFNLTCYYGLKSLLLSFLSFYFSALFYKHFDITSEELIEMEARNIYLAEKKSKDGFAIFAAEYKSINGCKELIQVLDTHFIIGQFYKKPKSIKVRAKAKAKVKVKPVV
jgi:hypothetical protein